MQQSWPEQRRVHHIHYIFEEQPATYDVTAEVHFDRSVNEEQMGDIPDLCDHMVHVLNELVQLHH